MLRLQPSQPVRTGYRLVRTVSPTRTFPRLSTILAGLFVTPPLPGGDAGANIEALSSVSRTLNFRLTVRDNRPYVPSSTIGQTQFTDMTVTVTNTSGPFQVTSPNTNVSWAGGSSQTITWDVANTTPPVSCANVKISLSTDGGTTFPTVLSASTPNDGSEAVTIPNGATTTARVKVEAVGNIFFDISDSNFTITGGATPTPTPTATPTATPTPHANSASNAYANPDSDSYTDTNGVADPIPYSYARPPTTPTARRQLRPLQLPRPMTSTTIANQTSCSITASTRQTAIWYMHNNVFAGGAFGPTLPAGWNVIDVADFNRDGNNDYALFNSSTRQTAIWYLSGVTLIGGALGPTIPSGWALVATGDFNGDGKPDFVLYNAEHAPNGSLVLKQQRLCRRLSVRLCRLAGE